jgi:sulfotransferase family protein
MTMPNFLIIGAAKSGTSALYAYLRQHPQVLCSDKKEPGFFAFEGHETTFRGPGDRKYNRNCVTELGRYRELFKKAVNKDAVGEASTVYLYNAEAPGRILRHVPDVKLLAVLRNPVDRAYSGYRFLVRDRLERLPSFEDALEAENARIAANWQHIWHHKRLGFYYEQLKRYYDLFPREQLMISLFEDLEAAPVRVIQDMFRFLGVGAGFTPDVSLRYNVSGTPRSRILHAALARPNAAKDVVKGLLPRAMRRRVRAKLMARNIRGGTRAIALGTRQYLVDLYHDDIRKLEVLIDRDLSHWLIA